VTRVHPIRARHAALTIAVPLLVASLTIGCSKDETTSTGGGASTAAPTTTAKAGETTTTKAAAPTAPGAVSIKDFLFNPESQTVKVGEKVTWTNEDPAKHHVISDTGSTFDSGVMSEKQTYSVTADKAGTFKYHCNIHETMKGTIVVT